MVGLFIALLTAGAQAGAHAVLFVGNSYTQYNAPNSIDGNYAQLLAEGMPAWEVDSRRYARGGYNLVRHLGDATGTSELHEFLTDTDTYAWDLVVLQDQSQTPGLPHEQDEWIWSRDAAVDLAEMITDAGATPRLFMTWGYRNGDALNAWRFPDYPTMQGLLAEGYYAYAEAIVAAGHPVEVVPVGMAWQHIYDGHTAVGEDPLQSSALFSRLYSGDGSHPSVLGSYLASLVFYAAFTGQSPVGLEWAPDVITERDRDAMQQAAEAVMADALSGGEDTGEGSAGPEDTGEQDTDPGPSGDDSGEGAVADSGGDAQPEADKSGCSCAASGGLVPWVAILSVIALIRSRP